MKLKQLPADFRVEELTDLQPGDCGPFALYRLYKVGWTTPDALAVVRRHWNLDHRRVSYGGLKDRHADTSQHFTVHHGPARDFTRPGVTVRHLGRTAEPFTAAHIRANRFVVVLRHLKPVNCERAVEAIPGVERIGLPNYFDDQRFGSVAPGQPFVARELIRGDFEAALKLALAAPYEHDRAVDKKEKATLIAGWGDWAGLKVALQRSHARSLVDYLVSHPADFKGAVARLRPDLQGLYLSAYQSHVWNRTLDRWLRDRLPPAEVGSVGLKLGPLSVPLADPGWDGRTLPLPSARLKPAPDADWRPALDAVLAADGLALDGMRIHGLDRPFFSRGERPMGVRPAGLTAEPGDDELNRGRLKLTLRFELPRGSYATILVKRLTALKAPGP
jgi:tRNA pseudouridine13 synthase